MFASRLRLLYKLVGAAAWLAIAALAVLVAGWFMLGGGLYSVQTGSMQPVLRPGDAVLIWPASLPELRAGQVVSFRDKTQLSLITTHRVVSINLRTGTLVTQGDNTAQQDLPISSSQLVGRAVAVAPWLGRVLGWLRSPVGLVVAVYIPAVAVIAAQLNGLHRRTHLYQINKT